MKNLQLFTCQLRPSSPDGGWWLVSPGLLSANQDAVRGVDVFVEVFNSGVGVTTSAPACTQPLFIDPPFLDKIRFPPAAPGAPASMELSNEWRSGGDGGEEGAEAGSSAPPPQRGGCSEAQP